MDPYSIIDAPLDHRAALSGWTVIKEWDGAPARFFYIGGRPPWECFQVSIGVPEAGTVAIIARSVDTNDDAEFEQTWRGQITDLDDLLTLAVSEIEKWKTRAS